MGWCYSACASEGGEDDDGHVVETAPSCWQMLGGGRKGPARCRPLVPPALLLAALLGQHLSGPPGLGDDCASQARSFEIASSVVTGLANAEADVSARLPL